MKNIILDTDLYNEIDDQIALAYVLKSKDVLNSYGVTFTNWNCMTGDAEGKNTVEAQMAELQATMEGDDAIIVLMHDASDKQTTVDSLPSIIGFLREQGYSFRNFYDIF